MAAFRSHMPRALVEARAALERGEVPVGAVIVSASGEVLAAAGNETRARCDPTAHAEIIAIREACAVTRSERLPGASLWVTLEPCPMCAAAIAAARIATVHFGAEDPKSGGVLHGPRIFSQDTAHHRPEVISGSMETDCAALLTEFFKKLRRKGGERNC